MQAGDRVRLLSYRCLLGFRRIHIEDDAAAQLERRLSERGLLPPARPEAGHESRVPGATIPHAGPVVSAAGPAQRDAFLRWRSTEPFPQ
jgi:hypothetical protein